MRSACTIRCSHPRRLHHLIRRPISFFHSFVYCPPNFLGTVSITSCCSLCFSDEYGFRSPPSTLAVAFGPEATVLPTEGFLHLSLGNGVDSNCCCLLFSFLQFTANPELICLFAHEFSTDPLSRSAQATIPNDDAKMKVQIDSFFSYTISFAVSFHFFSSRRQSCAY